MPWYDYIAAFFAGAFLANVVPHFVNGFAHSGWQMESAYSLGLDA